MAEALNRGGAPRGDRHGKAVHRQDVVEFARTLYFDDRLKVRQIRELLPCVNYETLKDWIYFKTRVFI
jgi:hypothetical protein